MRSSVVSLTMESALAVHNLSSLIRRGVLEIPFELIANFNLQVLRACAEALCYQACTASTGAGLVQASSCAVCRR